MASESKPIHLLQGVIMGKEMFASLTFRQAMILGYAAMENINIPKEVLKIIVAYMQNKKRYKCCRHCSIIGSQIVFGSNSKHSYVYSLGETAITSHYKYIWTIKVKEAHSLRTTLILIGIASSADGKVNDFHPFKVICDDVLKIEVNTHDGGVAYYLNGTRVARNDIKENYRYKLAMQSSGKYVKLQLISLKIDRVVDSIST